MATAATHHQRADGTGRPRSERYRSSSIPYSFGRPPLTDLVACKMARQPFRSQPRQLRYEGHKTMTVSPNEYRARPIELSIESWTKILIKSMKRAISRIGSEHQIRRDIGELTALDDRMLADMGLSRSNIEHVVRYGRQR